MKEETKSKPFLGSVTICNRNESHVLTGSDDKEDAEEERKLDPKHNPDLRNFVRARLDVCREQLNDVLSALKQYCHTGEICRQLFTVISLTFATEIPRVREAQKLAFEALVNVTQVSTFFAGVVGTF